MNYKNLLQRQLVSQFTLLIIPTLTTGTILTAIIRTVTDTVHTIRTINLLTKAALDIPTS
jgi:hypothetical protein